MIAVRHTRYLVSAALLLVTACGDDASDGASVEPDAGLDVGAEDTGEDTSSDAGEDAMADASEDAGVDVPPPIEPEWCESETVHLYDPFVRDELDLWPDDLWTRADADSPTGSRLDVSNAPWVAATPDLLRPAIEDLSAVSGFARNGGVVLRFSAALDPTAVPTGDEGSTQSEALQWWDLGTSPPSRVPYEARPGDEDRDIVMWPLRPLRPNARHAVIATTALVAADGGCVAPSERTRDILTGRAVGTDLEPLVAPWTDALAAVELDAASVSAITTFSTHDDLAVFADIAARIAARDAGWIERPTCEDREAWRECVGVFDGRDYRTDDYISAATDGTPWAVPATIWLPLESDGAAPVVLFGHGLNGGRGQGGSVARRMAPNGWAVVAADAMQHAEHPTAEGGDGNLNALNFLGIDLDAFTIDALRLRGNFNQTALDRITLLRVLENDPDVDGDGVADVDVSSMAYWGISLGGMLGPATLALDERIEAGVLHIAGGRLLTFATDTENVAAFKPAIIALIGSEALFERLLPVAASLVDAADPATWAAHLLRDRIVGDPQHILLPVSSNDEVVPPSSGQALARALGAPHLAPVVLDTDLLTVVEGPLTGNLAGDVSAAYFQLDRVSRGEEVVLSSHGNTPHSAEGDLQALTFLETWLDAGTPTIIDPYVELGTPPLPAE